MTPLFTNRRVIAKQDIFADSGQVNAEHQVEPEIARKIARRISSRFSTPGSEPGRDQQHRQRSTPFYYCRMDLPYFLVDSRG